MGMNAEAPTRVEKFRGPAPRPFSDDSVDR